MNQKPLHLKPGDELELFAKVDGETCPWVNLSKILPTHAERLEGLLLLRKNLALSHSLLELLQQINQPESIVAQGIFTSATIYYARFFTSSSKGDTEYLNQIKQGQIHQSLMDFYQHLVSFNGNDKFESSQCALLLHPHQKEVVGLTDYSMRAAVFDQKFCFQLNEHLRANLILIDQWIDDQKQSIYLELSQFSKEELYANAIYGDLPLVV